MSEKSPIRLQKFLSEHGYCSRREAEILIKKGLIIVNGVPSTLGDRVTIDDTFIIQGKKFVPKKEKKIVLAFHKPVGVECTLQTYEDVQTLKNFQFPGKHVFPIGRLDKESHGLLLMTNDGDLANKLMHPRYKHQKEYLVVTSKPITKDHIEQLGNGSIKINKKSVRPCTVNQVEPNVFSIILTEGKNRQIRRMCKHLGLKVMELLRVRIENIMLGEIKAGRWRHVNENEMKKLLT
jgi:23S rRNA pseudouridine2604 synthase